MFKCAHADLEARYFWQVIGGFRDVDRDHGDSAVNCRSSHYGEWVVIIASGEIEKDEISGYDACETPPSHLN